MRDAIEGVGVGLILAVLASFIFISGYEIGKEVGKFSGYIDALKDFREAGHGR